MVSSGQKKKHAEREGESALEITCRTSGRDTGSWEIGRGAALKRDRGPSSPLPSRGSFFHT